MKNLWLPILLLNLTPLFAYAQLVGNREPALARLPEQLNEKAILECLPKMKGFLTNEETTSLDSFKTKAERLYGLQRPMLEYRELNYTNQNNEKWRVEFYLTPDSVWGKEKYRSKYFRANETGAFMEVPAPSKDEVMTKEAMLRYSQYEQINSDTRWERFAIPGSPKWTYRSRDFKLYELNVSQKSPKLNFTCTTPSKYPFCHCSKAL